MKTEEEIRASIKQLDKSIEKTQSMKDKTSAGSSEKLELHITIGEMTERQKALKWVLGEW